MKSKKEGLGQVGHTALALILLAMVVGCQREVTTTGNSTNRQGATPKRDLSEFCQTSNTGSDICTKRETIRCKREDYITGLGYSIHCAAYGVERDQTGKSSPWSSNQDADAYSDGTVPCYISDAAPDHQSRLESALTCKAANHFSIIEITN